MSSLRPSAYAAEALDANQSISANHLTYIAEQYPPYSYEIDGKISGIAVDVLEKVWEKMGWAGPVVAGRFVLLARADKNLNISSPAGHRLRQEQ